MRLVIARLFSFVFCGFARFFGIRRRNIGAGGSTESEQAGKCGQTDAEIAGEAVDGNAHFGGMGGDESIDGETEGDAEYAGRGEGVGEDKEGGSGTFFGRKSEAHFGKEEEQDAALRNGDDITDGTVEGKGKVKIAGEHMEIDSEHGDERKNHADDGAAEFFMCTEDGGDGKSGEKDDAEKFKG